MEQRKRKMLKSILAVLASISPLFFSALNAGADEPDLAKIAPDTTGSESRTDGAKREGKKDDRTFEEVVKDYTPIQGLFTLYQKEEDASVLLEIKPDQFDKVFLCSITREMGDGTYFDSGAMLGEFPFVFKRVGKRVFFIHKNVYFRADKDAAIHRAVERGVTNSIVALADIQGNPHPDRGSVLVDATGFFIQDIGMVADVFSEQIKKVKYTFDKAGSYFGALKSFPENTEIEAVLHFASSAPKPALTIPDARSFQHVYHYSLSTLPASDFTPRFADDRIGHFLTMYQDYTSVLRDSPYNRYVDRWYLRKAEPRDALSSPAQPIVFWLENTIPVEYRDAVMEGILIWNKAFERIGFKDAIVVRQQPDDADWDAADVRYSTVRWIVKPGGGYAVGPSRTNPFTGQIYDADIRVSADMLRYVFQSYEEFAKPVAIGDSVAASLGLVRDGARGFCDHQAGSAEQAGFGWGLLGSRGAKVDAKRYLHDFLVMVIAHEMGHALGLRHNFKASTFHPLESLQDRGLTAEQGLTGSVMDYIPVNISPEGRPQGEYFQTALGPYDYWAIEYAYHPIDAKGQEAEQVVLDKIASRGADPTLSYGTDEDAFEDPRGIDPTCNRWDLGSDPIAFYTERISLAKELWTKIQEQFEKEGNRYQKYRSVFERGIHQYRIAVINVTKFIGGVYHRRDHVGDPKGRIPFEPVSAARQREALEFLATHVFGPNAFSFPPELLNRLAPERFVDFTEAIWETKRIDYPVHDVVLSIQLTPLDHLYDPVLLSRVLDIELRYANGQETFTMSDMFQAVREAIWSEVSGQDGINSFRRALQRAHLKKLIGLVVEPAKGVPEDASTLARADLIRLKAGISQAISNEGLDGYSLAHLDETLARIDAALKAGIERRIGN